MSKPNNWKLEISFSKLIRYEKTQCLTNTKVKSIFPLNGNKRSLRNNNKYLVKFATTERYRKSAVPYMQNLLNEQEKVKEKLVRFKGHWFYSVPVMRMRNIYYFTEKL